MLVSTVAEIEEQIDAGRPNACTVEWVTEDNLFGAGEPDPMLTIKVAIEEFRRRGWAWDGRDLTKNGWLVFFRSQGILSQPICQWSRIRA